MKKLLPQSVTRVAGLLALCTGCSPESEFIDAAIAGRPEYVAPSDSFETEKPKDLWWAHIGEQSSAAFWLGPPMGPEGPWQSRYCTLVCSLPSTPHPLSCKQFELPYSSSDPVICEGHESLFRIELKPAEGLTWGQVERKDQIEVHHTGLY